MNAAAEELDQNFPVLPSQSLPASHANGDPNPFFGRVVYAPGLAVDQPVSVTRYEYQDSPPGSPLVGVWPSPLTIMPFWDYRGTAIFGLFADGTAVKPLQLSQGQKACPNPGEATADRCVLLQWSFSNNAYNQAFAGVPTPSWFGSLLQNGLGAAGLEDHRARLYDPKTGRFTQEDPIGLAGGLNLYGFANGDPVNFSDPFGLTGCDKEKAACPPPAWAAFTEKVAEVRASAAVQAARLVGAVGRALGNATSLSVEVNAGPVTTTFSADATSVDLSASIGLNVVATAAILGPGRRSSVTVGGARWRGPRGWWRGILRPSGGQRGLSVGRRRRSAPRGRWPTYETTWAHLSDRGPARG